MYFLLYKYLILQYKSVTTKFNIPNIPCHKQAKEKTIKLLTEDSMSLPKKERKSFVQKKIEIEKQKNFSK